MSSRKSFSLVLATIFALTFPHINGLILERRPYVWLGNPELQGLGPAPLGAASPPDLNNPLVVLNRTTAATPVAAPTPENADTSATPALHAEITAPAPLGTPGCLPWAQCNLFYQYVNVYYWPENTNNTSCLLADQGITSPPVIQNIQSPSVYVVFPSIRGYDGCKNIGPEFVNLTTSFASDALSTVGLDSTTYPFNFGDLPCPPPEVEWDFSKGPYAPLLAPPDFLFHLDPAFARCIPAATQGIDPYTTLTTATAASDAGPVGVGKPGNPPKRALERARPEPWGPQETAKPIS